MRKLIIIILTLVLTLNSSFAFAGKYGIIRGDKVNVREKPLVTSKVLAQLMEGELVFNVEKIDSEKETIANKENVWYKITTQDKKTGYVFGSFIYDFSKSKVSEKEFELIIDESYRLHCLGDRILSIKLDKNDNIIIFSVHMISPGEWISKIYLFELSHNNIKRYLDANFVNGSYYINKDYIFIWDKHFINAYNRSIFVKGAYVSDPNNYYKKVASMASNNGNFNISETKDNYLQFNPSTMTLELYLREKLDKPFKVEKYIFKDDKFQKVE